MHVSPTYKSTLFAMAVLLALSGPAAAQSWDTTGNIGTNPGTNFLGTRDNRDLVIKTNDDEAMRIRGNGSVGIGTANPTAQLEVAGFIRVVPNSAAQLHIGRFSAAFPNAYIVARSGVAGPAGLIFRTADPAGAERNRMTINSEGLAGIGTGAPQQTLDVQGSGVTFRHTDGGERAFLDTAGGFQSGAVATLGPNGNLNAVLIDHAQDPNLGAVAVFDAGQNAQAYLIVDTDGRGWVVADVKSFRVPNAKEAGTDIVYASIEGPEAAAYVRGSARLSEGRAVITLPDHFLAVASPRHLTVQLTPLSGESLGLGVVEKSLKGVVVQELHGGKGSYEFDWEVKSVRRGFEDYKVIRKSRELSLGRVDE